MDPKSLAEALETLGCPHEKCDEMASQLIRRAGQLSQERGGSSEEALAYLTRLMAGGWAAQARGIRLPN